MTKCGAVASHRYTWAGQNESFCCPVHAVKLSKVAAARSYYLLLIPIEPQKDVLCTQNESKEPANDSV